MPKPLPRGVLVAFEGIDGSGKTTQASMLEDWAESFDVDVVRTKEPTAGPWGARIRNSKFHSRMKPAEELECFINDRREHVAQVIAPALARGALVIVDRYYYSTVAYQGARGLNPQDLLRINRTFAPVPDLVFLLDIDPASGLERIHTRGAGQDLFETLPELTRAREVFRSLPDAHIVTVDATLSREQIHALVVKRLVEGPMLGWALPANSTAEALGPEERAALETAHRIAHDPTIPEHSKAEALLAAVKRRR